MRTRLILVLLVLLTVTISSPPPALAVTINVLGSFGNFSLPEGRTGTATLTGNIGGFTANAVTDFVLANIGPFSCFPCFPGDPIDVSVVAVGTALSGSATLNGKTFSMGGVDSPAHLNLFFSGPPPFAPPINVAPFVALTTPVNFSGAFIHVADPSLSPLFHPEFQEDLVAFAKVTIAIERSVCNGPAPDCWNLVSARYELTPTPEPATLLLVGTTMGGLGLVARLRQRRRKPPAL